MSPAVSVIVVNWNSGPWLAQCCAALRAQTCTDFELILVDNASSDTSLAAALPLPGQAQLLRQTHNLGFAAANNLAARTARGHWLAFLNPDALPAPDWLAHLLAATRAFPQFDLFGCRQLMAAHTHLLDGIGDAYHVSGLAWRIGHGMADGRQSRMPTEIFSPCAAAALIRRDLFAAAAGFDEDFFCYLEDVDLGFRLRLAGARALYVPDAVVRHAGSVCSGRRSDFTVFHSQRNLVWVFAKCMPWPLALLYLPAHLLMNVAAIGHFVRRGQTGVVLRAKWAALCGLPRVWQQRMRIQAGRRASSRNLLRLMARGWPRRHALPDRRGTPA